MNHNFACITLSARLLLTALLLTWNVLAQTTAFTYQGRLTDGGAATSGPYDLQFKLFDAVTNGNQVGTTVTRDDLNVTNGVFNTTLDFGAAAFPGATRWLEISVRAGASTGAYTTLTPRQQINSTPYAMRALAATTAETVTGPIPASQLTGTLPPGVLPAGGAYIENTTTQQAASNFHISGDGTAGGTLAGNAINAATQFQLNGTRFLSGGGGNVFLGYQTGNFNTGLRNTLLGNGAGYANRAGEDNTYVGVFAGGGSSGINAGNSSRNTLFGGFAGYLNNGSDNAIFGYRAGYNTQGDRNAFFGALAGQMNTSGGGNAFFGTSAGQANVMGSENAFFGIRAGLQNNNGSSNTFIGRSAGAENVNGNHNTFVGGAAGSGNTSGSNNTFIGAFAATTKPDIEHSIAIGAEARVERSNTIVIGSERTNTVLLKGTMYISTFITGGSGAIPMCLANAPTINGEPPPAPYRVSGCLSSRRYKTNITPLSGGLSLINRLRPVSFDWKETGQHDLGFIAEEVAEVEPQLTFRNEKGEIEGVKYQLISAFLVNAVKEQQAQIEQLKKIVCADHPSAAVCQPKQQ